MKQKQDHPVVCFGEALWDILPQGKLPGGAPMNVAYHLNQMKENAVTITRIGKDELGDELLQLWKSRSIDTAFFQYDEKISTGTVNATSDVNNEMHYDIVLPSAWDYIEWKDEYLPLIENASYFVFGSLVTRNEVSKNTLLKCLEVAQTKVLDINLRAPFFNKEMIELLLSRANILKLNNDELNLISGWYGNFENDNEKIDFLHKKFSLNTIIATRGADGAILYAENEFYYHHGFSVIVADTVGSGDAFLARIIKGLLEKEPYAEIIKHASATGAFIASKNGACPEYSLAEIESEIFM